MLLLWVVVGSIAGGMSGGSGWLLFVSVWLFYLVGSSVWGFVGDMPESAPQHVLGLLIPRCCLHWGIRSTSRGTGVV